MATKYPKIDTNAFLVQFAYKNGLLPTEPLDPASNLVAGYCLESGCPFRINLEKLRKSQIDHSKCARTRYDLYEIPQFNNKTQCKGCGKVGYHDGDDEHKSLCGFCETETFWSKKQELLVVELNGKLVLFISTQYANTDYRQLPHRGVIIYKAEMRLRDPEMFYSGIKELLVRNNWKEAKWFIAQPNATSLERSFIFETEYDLNKVRELAEFYIGYLSTEAKFLVKRSNRKVKVKAPPPPKPSKSVGGEIELEEGLPSPWVHYPDPKQFIFAFGASLDADPFLCSCIRNGIDFLAKTKEMEPFDYVKKNTRMFPKQLTKKIQKLTKYEDLYQDNLCHACNRKIPSLVSSTYSYASFTFANLNWYKKQELLALEIEPGYYWASIKRTPDEFTDYLNIVNSYFKDKIGKLPDVKKARAKINSMIEYRVKERFELTNLGGSSQSETLLYQIIKDLVKPSEVVRHLRPKWLEGLEIDIWVPEFSLAIEYQGEQHFKAVETWGGLEGLKDLQIRDERKRNLCKKNNITLIEINYYENIDAKMVSEKISNYITRE